jgi:RNA polymerase sigma factor (sigma-70 family)
MAHVRSGAVGEQLRTLWSVGAVGGADDAALIARFTGRRDEAAEVAFRVLVERHGPMVQRVCRQVIGDGHAAQDAAQAVFMVLARKAGSIRVGSSVAPGLHGGARRVAARARCRDTSRQAGEGRAAVAAAERRREASATPTADDWEAVHDEVGKLPEKYRTPVVLCYLEGQTYEQAARRIGCPVGTIRVRLSRARDRLRDRLTRRGFGPAAIVPSGWSGESPTPAPPALTAGWTNATAHAAWTLTAGRAAMAGTVPASALALSDEVIRMMAIAHWKVVVAGILALGVTSAGVVVVASGGPTGQEKRGAAPPGAATPKKVDPAQAPAPVPRPLETPASRFVAAARQRLEAQRAFYEEGRITIDRYIDASRLLMVAEIDAATTHTQRVAAARAHLKRAEEIAKHEQSELDVGRGTVSDLAEARLAQAQAEVEVKKVETTPDVAEVEALKKRVDTMEKQLDRVIQILGRQGNDFDFPQRKGVPQPRR